MDDAGAAADLSDEEVAQLRTLLDDDEFQAAVSNGDKSGRWILPTPGFVVKTRDRYGQKVFVNVCASKHVRGMAFKRGMVGDEEHEGVSIPLSACEAQACSDALGHDASVHDVVANDDVIERARSDTAFRDMLARLAVQWVSSKYDRGLDENFTLPRATYKGRPRTQRIRADGGQVKVAEVGSAPPTSASATQFFSQHAAAVQKQERLMKRLPPQVHTALERINAQAAKQERAQQQQQPQQQQPQQQERKQHVQQTSAGAAPTPTRAAAVAAPGRATNSARPEFSIVCKVDEAQRQAVITISSTVPVDWHAVEIDCSVSSLTVSAGAESTASAKLPCPVDPRTLTCAPSSASEATVRAELLTGDELERVSQMNVQGSKEAEELAQRASARRAEMKERLQRLARERSEQLASRPAQARSVDDVLRELQLGDAEDVVFGLVRMPLLRA